MSRDSVISIDMGGTKVLACIVNSKEGIIAKLKRPTDPSGSSEDYVHQLAKIVKNLVSKSDISKKKIKAVCLGIPGSLNPVTGKIGLAPNIGLKDFNIKAHLEMELDFPVLIENDANLGALGIKNFGVGRKSDNLLAVFVGTGIGAGLIFNEKLYRGSDFVAGEIGHMIVEKNGPECGCGRKGCFEALASRTAIVSKIISDIDLGKDSVLSKAVKSGERIKSKLLLSAVTKNDKVTCKRVSEACTTIGEVLASVTNLLNLDTIVLAGGMIEALNSFMMPLIEESFQEHVLRDASENLKIVSSKLGDDAAIFGGIALTEEFLNVRI
jgi:glucokinase